MPREKDAKTELSELRESQKQLEAKIQKIQNFFWVAAVVATIFGITGQQVWSGLKDAKNDIDQLQKNTKQLEESTTNFRGLVDEAIGRVNKAADDALNSNKEKAKHLITDVFGKSINVDPSGRVGIGTKNQSGHQLDIASTQGSYNNSAIRVLFPSGGALANTEFAALAHRKDAWSSIYAKQGEANAAAFFDGKVGIGAPTPNYTLDVRGTIGSNDVQYHSDIRFKHNIEAISNSLEKISKLRGIKFEWKVNEYKQMNFASGRHIGVIAQEVEQIFPELVSADKDGYRTVEYANLVAVLIEAIKELKAENEAMRKRVLILEEKSPIQ